MKKAIIVSTLAAFLLVVAVPVFGAQAKPTLSSLAQQFQKIAAKVKNMTSKGTLPAKYVTYKNSDSKLEAKTVQGAIDEIGIALSQLIAGADIDNVGAQSLLPDDPATPSVDESLLKETTWKGYVYTAVTGPRTNGLVKKSKEVTVTFTPTSVTTGTFTSSPLYILNPIGSSFAYTGSGTSYCGNSISGTFPEGTFEGKYDIVNDFLVWSTPTKSDNASCEIFPANTTKIASTFAALSHRGETIHLDIGGQQAILTRQQ